MYWKPSMCLRKSFSVTARDKRARDKKDPNKDLCLEGMRTKFLKKKWQIILAIKIKRKCVERLGKSQNQLKRKRSLSTLPL